MIRSQWNEVLHHVFLILCQINEHLHDALLTKLLAQFIEVPKRQFLPQHLECMGVNLAP